MHYSVFLMLFGIDNFSEKVSQAVVYGHMLVSWGGMSGLVW